MKYEFPYIEYIGDVLPALEGEGGEAFGVMERGPFRVINYHYQDSLTFTGPNEAMRRECRGLVFDLETGRILNRRFHKFFNVNEKIDTQHDVIDWTADHTVMEKVDGSMISPVAVGGDIDNIRWISKMGLTDTSLRAETFVANKPEYRKLARTCLSSGVTSIFEWCSRRDRIVIDHAHDDLVLLAVRCNRTGVYMGRNAVEELGGLHKITTVKTHKGFSGSALDYARDLKDTEGFVIQFGNGHMVKLKTDWYVSIHKAKELLGSPRRVVENAINGTVDDLLAILPHDDQKRVEEDVKTFWNFFNYAVTMKENLLRDIKAEMDRKTFALGPAKLMFHPGVLFTAWDGSVSVREAMLTVIKKNLGTDRRFDETISSLIGVIQWTTGSHEALQDA